MLDNDELIEKAKIEFKKSNPSILVKDAFVTETTDHTLVVVLKDDNSVLANYQVRENGELLRLDHAQKSSF